MKFFKLILSFLPILLLYNCDDESPDCVCTEEFRTYLVTVVDSLGNPVDSLETIIVNDIGKEYNFGACQPPPFMPGAYYVMTDGYQHDFSIKPGKIFFTGAKNNLEVTGEYLFNTDDCRCHVYRVAGPDTLVLK
jgi:hypothetical protein